ncbi:MAG: putative porin [Bdellovibrionales bacterium]|nr:putative porin [Bdellovibrionales bacterium]
MQKIVQKSLFTILGVTLISALTGPMSHAQEESWADKLKISGDFRLRQDYSITSEAPAVTGDTDTSRFRSRIRGRIKLQAQVDENVQILTRITTAENGSPTSGNTTFTSSGQYKSIYFDQAYAKISHFGVEARLGKMENPIYKSGDSELIWDNDFTPEGASASYKLDMGDMALTFLGFGYWIEERKQTATADGVDTGLLGGQLIATYSQEDSMAANIYVSSFNFTNMATRSPIYANGASDGSKGNTFNGTSPNLTYANNYHLINAGLDVSLDMLPIKTKIYFDWVQNTLVDNKNEGFITGLTLGSMKKQGEWMLGFNWRETEQDAVVAGLQDSDFADGLVNSKGGTVIVGYGLTDATSIRLWVSQARIYMTETTATDYTRGLFDIAWKF